MQIIRGGKVSWLHDLFVIRGKTFAIVQQFKTPYNKKEKNLLENLRDWRLIRENHESFPQQTICIIRYSKTGDANLHRFVSNEFFHTLEHLLHYKKGYFKAFISCIICAYILWHSNSRRCLICF